MYIYVEREDEDEDEDIKPDYGVKCSSLHRILPHAI